MKDAIEISVAFATWIGEKQAKDSWFKYDKNSCKWYVYMKGYLTTQQLYELWESQTKDTKNQN